MTNLSSSVIPAGQDARGLYLGKGSEFEMLNKLFHFMCVVNNRNLYIIRSFGSILSLSKMSISVFSRTLNLFE